MAMGEGTCTAATKLVDRPLIKVRDLAFYFVASPPPLIRLLERRRRSLLKAVDGVSFDIAPGTTFSVVGESGCGKSTIARLLVGLLPPTRGRIEFDGVDITSDRARRDARALRRRMQIIFQDSTASLDPRWRVSAIVGEPIGLFHLADGQERTERVSALLNAVGLDRNDGERYPHQFSSGQRQRISIARALAGNPDFIVCDEPTSSLDVSVQAQILNLLKDLQARLGLTYLFISHNMAVVSYVSNEIAVMYLGRFCEVAPTQELLRSPRHPYTRMLLETIPDIDAPGIRRPPIGGEAPNAIDIPSDCCAFHSRCPFADDRCRRERPALRPVGPAQVACHGIEENRIE